MNWCYLVYVLVLATVAGKRPPWYKPCWLYSCNDEKTLPVCGLDEIHGPRLFRNPCRMYQHNYCYTRHYNFVNVNLTIQENIDLCNKMRSEKYLEETKTPY